MRNKQLLIVIFISFFITGGAFSQDLKPKNDVLNSYLSDLNIDNDKKEKFINVLEKFSPLFKNTALSVKEYNTLLKKETLEIYGILTTEEFALYKELKKSIEPEKKYRIENTN